ncbi:hypothetical protein L6452_32681 [Arctium lappa]|uniref:Uncharacterized protein n=1 Tax=Arctium lappa TaxID=4217 RepID=A0ACB8Z4D1_ARCLA|nr:hypothetical protein L6452_32681 [Arctium lappa]
MPPTHDGTSTPQTGAFPNVPRCMQPQKVHHRKSTPPQNPPTTLEPPNRITPLTPIALNLNLEEHPTDPLTREPIECKHKYSAPTPTYAVLSQKTLNLLASSPPLNSHSTTDPPCNGSFP